jgi:hypothetical protein
MIDWVWDIVTNPWAFAGVATVGMYFFIYQLLRVNK